MNYLGFVELILHMYADPESATKTGSMLGAHWNNTVAGETRI